MNDPIDLSGWTFDEIAAKYGEAQLLDRGVLTINEFRRSRNLPNVLWGNEWARDEGKYEVRLLYLIFWHRIPCTIKLVFKSSVEWVWRVNFKRSFGACYWLFKQPLLQRGTKLANRLRTTIGAYGKLALVKFCL